MTALSAAAAVALAVVAIRVGTAVLRRIAQRHPFWLPFVQAAAVRFDPPALRARAARFDRPAFARRVREYVMTRWDAFAARPAC